MAHVFISYSRKDKATMQRIKRILIESGLEVWTDEGIAEGTPNWQLAIENAIEEADCVVCILTPLSKRSNWVREELMYATLYEKQIYMLHTHGDYKRVAILGFAVAQLIDLREDEAYETRLLKLANRIHEVSRERSESDATHQLRVVSRQHLIIEDKNYKPKSQIEELVNKFLPTEIPATERHVFVVSKGNQYTDKSVYTIQNTVITIGRGSDNAIHVDDDSVSRDHSQLIYTNEGFLIRDLGSTNGTFINQTPVDIRTLSDGDTIQIGQVVLLLYKIIQLTDDDEGQTLAKIAALSQTHAENESVSDEDTSQTEPRDEVHTVKVDDLRKLLDTHHNSDK